MQVKEQILDLRGLVDTARQIAQEHGDRQIELILEVVSGGITDIIEERYKKLVQPVEPPARTEK